MAALALVAGGGAAFVHGSLLVTGTDVKWTGLGQRGPDPPARGDPPGPQAILDGRAAGTGFTLAYGDASGRKVIASGRDQPLSSAGFGALPGLRPTSCSSGRQGSVRGWCHAVRGRRHPGM